MIPYFDAQTLEQLAIRHLLMDGGITKTYTDRDEAIRHARTNRGIIIFDYDRGLYEVVIPVKQWPYVVEMTS